MAKESVEQFLIDGGENEKMRNSYDSIREMDEFVARANTEGYDFTKEELESVLSYNFV